MQKKCMASGHKKFFNHLIQRKMSESGISVSEEVKTYLSNLLQFYIFTDHLFKENPSGKRYIQPLAETYLCSGASSFSRKNSLKQVGDTSLYISGFFREALKRKTVSPDYYIKMGKAAYTALAELQPENVFQELADRFLDLIFILYRIQQHSAARAPYLLSLLNRYMDAPSRREAGELARSGISIVCPRKPTPH